LSSGIPMIVGGDELGRTQQGNNNAYCQDNRTTWFDWSAVDKDLLAFTRHLVALRRRIRSSGGAGF
jgi:isoamylase